MKKSLTKTITMLFTGILISSSSFGQEADSEKKNDRKLFEHQIGINATFFIQNFVSLNGGFLVGTPYDINYKFLYLLPEGNFISSVGLRTGFGYMATEGSSKNVINNSGNENRNVNYDYRFGVEAQKPIGKHWKCYLGLDYIAGSDDLKTKNSFVSGGQVVTSEVNDKTETTGYGPVIGMQFDFNKHISLGTELTFYATKSTNDRVSTSGFPNTLPQVTNGSSRSMNIITPTFINFIVRF